MTILDVSTGILILYRFTHNYPFKIYTGHLFHFFLFEHILSCAVHFMTQISPLLQNKKEPKV